VGDCSEAVERGVMASVGMNELPVSVYCVTPLKPLQHQDNQTKALVASERHLLIINTTIL
jgi:hypothetical protein